MKSWFSVENKANNSVNVSIVGDIGANGVSVAAFKQEIDKYPSIENLNIDYYSQGGDMYDGLFMFDYLVSHPAHKTGRVVNIAASAATLPLMAMDVVNMPANSKIMIHQPMANLRMANSDFLRKAASHMDELQSIAIDIYQHKTKLPANQIEEMINKETYLNAQEAVDLGFADRVTPQFNVKNQAFSLDEISTIRDFETFLREVGGLSRSQATGIVAKAKTIFQREASNDVEKQQLDQLQAVLNRLSIPKSILQD